MSEPLPSPWVDTGITKTVTVSGSARVIVHGGSDNFVEFNGEWQLQAEGQDNFDPDCPDGFNTNAQRRVHIAGPFSGSPDQLEDLSLSCQATSPQISSATYDFEETAGPYRLGCKLELIGSPANPQFAKDYQFIFAWFWDENTEEVSSMAGRTSGTRYPVAGSAGAWSTTQPVGMTPETSGLLSLGFAIQSNNSLDYDCFLTNLDVDGTTVDTSALNEGSGVLVGDGSGAAKGKSVPPNRNASGLASLPFILSYDVDVLKFGDTSTGVLIDTAHDTGLATPYTATETFQQLSWVASGFVGYEEVFVNAASAAAQTPAAWLSNDRHLILALGILTDDRANLTHYTPGSPITLASRLYVHRPDGATPSNFVASSGDITVTENPGSTVFDVAAPGSNVLRTLVEDWRGGTDYNRTKHTAGDDIWGWEWYRFLRFALNAPTGDDLTLTIGGALLEVDDPRDGSAPSYTEHAFTRVYTMPLSAGFNNIDVDLFFPAAGGPVRFGRVDTIKLEGFGVGTYTLLEMSLVSKANYVGEPLGGVINIKNTFGEPVSRGGNYDAFHASQNGANGTLELPDQSQKSETGEYGGAIPYINESNGGGGVTDSQLTVEQFLGRINALEGWTATYDSAAADDALEDSDGNRLGPEIAEFLDELYGHAEVVGETWQWDAQIRARRLVPAEGIEFLVRSERSKGYGALEFLAANDDGTATGAGEDFDILRNDTAAVLETVTTDEWSMAFSGPLPANNSFAVQVGEYILALRPRDRNRVPAIVPADEFHLDLLQLSTVPWWFRAARLGADAVVGRSLDAGASWPKSWTVASGLEVTSTPSIPTLAASFWGDVFTVLHDSTGTTRIYIYDGLADSWTLHASSASSSRRYPRLVVQQHRQVICGHDGTQLLFFESLDWFATAPSAIAGLALTIPAQLCVLRVDRRNWLHVVYVDGSGNLLHRYSEDGASWSATATLDTGVTGFVGYGQVLSAAILTYWKTTTLHALRLEEDYRTPATALTAPSGSWVRGTIPLWGSSRDDIHAVGKIGSDLETRVTSDLGVSFFEPS